MAVTVRVKVDTRGLARAKVLERRGAVAGLRQATEFLLGEAVAIVPLDESPLQDSGKPTVQASTLEGVVSFDTPYAVIQHENLDYRHAPGRTAKYLERPFDEHRQTLLAIVATSVRRALRGP